MLSKDLSSCLICGLKESPRENIKSDYFNYNINCDDAEKKEEASGVLKQLNVIFLFKNVLQVPSHKLESYLVKFGNPTNWQITLCSPCTQLINQAKDLHLQVLGAINKLKIGQKEIVDKAKLQNSQLSSLSSDNHEDPLKDNLVYQETWQFIKNHNYDNYFQEDPLLAGNKRLNKLLKEKGPLLSPTKVKIETVDPSENFPDQHSDTFSPNNSDHEDWTPPPPTNQNKPKRSRRSLRQRKSPAAPKATPKKPRRPKSKTEPDNQFPKYLARQCHKCPLSFRLITKLFQHLEAVHSTNQFPCSHPNCSKILTNREDFIYHQTDHEKPFKCDKCDSSFLRPKYLQRHTIDKHSDVDPDTDRYKDKKYGCDKCNFRDDSIPNLFTHLENFHLDNVTLRCPFKDKCDVTMKTVAECEIHEKGHLEKLQVTCHLCGVRITRKVLKKHMARKHGEGGGMLRCGVVGCGGKFFKKEGLDKHVRKMHGGEGEGDEGVVKVRYSCAFCGKAFFQKRGLVRHELIHKNEESKPFICEMCGKGFATSGNLYEHKKYTHYRTSLKLLKVGKFKRRGKGDEMDKEGDGDDDGGNGLGDLVKSE